MRYLKKEFYGHKRDGLENVKFTLLERAWNIYLYKRSDGEYEVIKAIIRKGQGIINKPESNIKFESVDNHQYPRGNDWNEYHTRDYEKALKQFISLAQEVAAKKLSV